ncbi:MAG: hypothetical protein IPO31_17005 [Candidatus Obscuribacter sp.]|nr:hypothetical protein [Candidatus Obscuribacter sp.]
MSDQSHSLNERQADRVESTQKQDAPSDTLMPSIDDYRNFNKAGSRGARGPAPGNFWVVII